ncbi:MAG: hypothetical protein KAI81_07845, partial [Candidatus Marinimicrobia bacterium]|nr:hypothetical protein [Candidatus Neomarinimicrobiota bacterium]
GIAQATKFIDTWIYFLTVYSNTNDEMISLRFNDNDYEQNLPIADSIMFQSGMTIGTPQDPLKLKAGHFIVNIDKNSLVSIDQTESLWDGNEKISFTVQDHGSLHEYATSVEAVFTVYPDYAPLVQGIPDQEIEQTHEFDSFDLDDYLILSDDDEITLSAESSENLIISIDDENNVIVSVNNSDWTGKEELIFIAKDQTTNGFYTKDKVNFTIFPIDHPPVLADIPDQLIGLSQSFETIVLSDYLTEIDGDSVLWHAEIVPGSSKDPLPEWTVDASDYEMSMTLTVSDRSQETSPDSNNHILAAFVGGECRGMVQATQFIDTWLYFLTVYSNTNDEALKFRFYDNDYELDLPIIDSLLFASGSSIGSPQNPLQMNAGHFLVTIDSSSIVTIEQTEPLWAGNEKIVFFVQDGGSIHEYSDSVVVNFTVYQGYSPIADAGDNQTVISGMLVTVDGGASSDIDTEILQYNWSSILDLDLSDDGSIASFTAPDKAGMYSFILSVSDGVLTSNYDTAFVTVMPLSTLDSLPDFYETPQTMGNSINISYSFPDFFVPDSVMLFYSKGGGSFMSKSMNSVSTKSGLSKSVDFNRDIPGDSVTSNGLAYYILAVDIQSNILVTDTMSIPVLFPEGYISSNMDDSYYPDGIEDKVWRMISVPQQLDDFSVKSIIETKLGSAGENSWQCYEWLEDAWKSAEIFTSGNGYWLNQGVEDTLSFDLGAGQSSNLSGLDINLATGWNLISSPYVFPIRIQIDSSLFTGLYRYGNFEGEGWYPDLTNECKPWGAYAIFNRSDVIQTINIDPLNPADEMDPQLNLAKMSDGWKLRIDIAGNEFSDRGTMIGRISKASESLDAWDLPKPVSPGDYISLSISREKWKNGLNTLSREFRSIDTVNGVWDLNLRTKGDHGILLLNSQLTGIFPENHDVKIIDCVNGDIHDLKNPDNFLISHIINTNSRPYKIVA